MGGCSVLGFYLLIDFDVVVDFVVWWVGCGC